VRRDREARLRNGIDDLRRLAVPLATAALNRSSLDSGRRCWLMWTKLAASSAIVG
jgi:hypothetical protein